MNKEQHKPIRLGYRTVLDGIRGFAVLMVLACHLGLPYATGGALGVDIFFTLSGFLITSILCEEWCLFGNIHLGQFYIRRLLRLYPALLIMVGFVSLISSGKTFFISSLTYTTNWVMAFKLAPSCPELGHTWTLSIEEQYYLFWPPILILILRYFKPQKALIIPVLLALVSILLRGVLWTSYSDLWQIHPRTDAHADGLLFGSALGMIFTFGMFPTTRRVKKILSVIFAALCVVILFSIFIFLMPDVYLSNIGVLLVEFFSLILIGLTVIYPETRLRKLFEIKPLVWIGTISYGLYIWQMPILVLLKIENFGIPENLSKLIKIFLIFLITIFSYRYIERPILRLKNRFRRNLQL